MNPGKIAVATLAFVMACGAGPSPVATAVLPATDPGGSMIHVRASNMNELVTKASAAWQKLAFEEGDGGVLDIQLDPGVYEGMNLVLSDTSVQRRVDVRLRGGPGVVFSNTAVQLGGGDIVVDGIVFEGHTNGVFLDLAPTTLATISRVSFVEARATGSGGMTTSQLLTVQSKDPESTVSLSDVWSVLSTASDGQPLMSFAGMNGAIAHVKLERVAIGGGGSSPALSLARSKDLTIVDSVLVMDPGVPMIRTSTAPAQLRIEGGALVVDSPDTLIISHDGTVPKPLAQLTGVRLSLHTPAEDHQAGLDGCTIMDAPAKTRFKSWRKPARALQVPAHGVLVR